MRRNTKGRNFDKTIHPKLNNIAKAMIGWKNRTENDRIMLHYMCTVA